MKDLSAHSKRIARNLQDDVPELLSKDQPQPRDGRFRTMHFKHRAANCIIFVFKDRQSVMLWISGVILGLATRVGWALSQLSAMKLDVAFRFVREIYIDVVKTESLWRVRGDWSN